MPNDINAALRTLTDAARGRAFFWDNASVPGSGWRLIDRVKSDADMNMAGVSTFSFVAVAADCTNVLLADAADTLVDAVIAAHSALAALPMAADVPVWVSALPPAANDALTDPLNVASAFGGKVA